jgi:hypothetical protein
MNEEQSRELWSQAWPLNGSYQFRLNEAIGFFRERATYPNHDTEGPTWDQLDEFLRLVLIDGEEAASAARLVFNRKEDSLPVTKRTNMLTPKDLARIVIDLAALRPMAFMGVVEQADLGASSEEVYAFAQSLLHETPEDEGRT